jgi:ABC-type microcin C transport system duplicated ATPase subunit YejF
MVGIPDPERRLKAFPHETSGRMAQRIMIAMASPRTGAADRRRAGDGTRRRSSTDPDLLRKLRDGPRRSLNPRPGVVAEMCDRVAVMYAGRS